MKLTPEGDKACITDGMPHSEKNIKKVWSMEFLSKTKLMYKKPLKINRVWLSLWDSQHLCLLSPIAFWSWFDQQLFVIKCNQS
jgi:hypothetical protein